MEEENTLYLIKDTVKEILIDMVQGTVVTYITLDNSNDIAITVKIKNFSYAYRYTIYKPLEQVQNGITCRQLAEKIVESYKRTIYIKFFKQNP